MNCDGIIYKFHCALERNEEMKKSMGSGFRVLEGF
jgi:hypothetical protein